MKTTLVREWMTADPVYVTPDSTLPDAHRMMMERHIRRLPVVDEGRVVGIITRGDIRGAQASEATTLSIFELNYLLSRLTVAKVMKRDPITITPDTTIGDAARTMLQNKIAGLPVVAAGKLVGIITESDIFRMVVKMWDGR